MFRLPSIRVARILGIPVEIDASWVVIFLLVAGVLSFDLFPSLFPGRPLAVDVASGVVSAALFFASLVAHEFSHSLVARRSGIRVERITLFIFGGVAQLSEEPRTPAREALMAAAGPAASLVLSGVFAVVFLLLSAAGAADVWWGPAVYLAAMNLALAGFNLAPGFPMDGGRLLRAYLWWALGDKRRATFAASGGGVLMATGMVAGGALAVLSGDLSGLWLALIGTFLGRLAVDAYRLQVPRLMAAGTPVADVPLAALALIDESAPAGAAAEALSGSPAAVAGVLADGELVGVIARERAFAELGSPVSAGEVASRDPRLLVDAAESLESAAARLDAGAPALVVVREGRAIGALTRDSLAGSPHG